MKHSGANDHLAPEQIGIEVRNIVDAYLHEMPNVTATFPDRVEKLASEIARWGAKTNLTAHPEDPEEIAFHILDSLAPIGQASSGLPQDAFAEGRRVLDLGSGAGFPGLVLAAACDASFNLIEVRRKRASFLQVAAAAMQCRNVTVVSRRAEVVVAESQYNVATARAFGEIGYFFRLASRALKPSGIAILYANPSQALSDEIAADVGLMPHSRLAYSLDRRAGRTQRVLAVWTRT